MKCQSVSELSRKGKNENTASHFDITEISLHYFCNRNKSKDVRVIAFNKRTSEGSAQTARSSKVNNRPNRSSQIVQETQRT